LKPKKWGEDGMTEAVKKQKANGIAGRLIETAGNIRYVSVSVNLKIQDGRIVDITHTVTESTRERNGGNE
jgi:hypothetical protein